MYFFGFKGNNLSVDMTEDTGRSARLANHSKKDPICATTVVDWENSSRLTTLFAKKDIEKGEELFFDDMDKKTAEAFPWLAQ